MAAVATETYVGEKPTVGERVIGAARQAAHMSHEARLLTSMATDAVEDGVHAAKRAFKSVQHRVGEFGDLKDEAIHCVKGRPLQAVGTAFGAGVALGLTVGWIAYRTGCANEHVGSPGGKP
jgi:ElaB/YqjD/DUF883 family membrane-anchored ribosome-binding protein